MSPTRLADDPQVHSKGVRASDKGFLNLGWREYLALLKWTGEQRIKEAVEEVPEKLQTVLGSLGIAVTMWRDLVWDLSVTLAERRLQVALNRWLWMHSELASVFIAVSVRFANALQPGTSSSARDSPSDANADADATFAEQKATLASRKMCGIQVDCRS